MTVSELEKILAVIAQNGVSGDIPITITDGEYLYTVKSVKYNRHNNEVAITYNVD